MPKLLCPPSNPSAPPNPSLDSIESQPRQGATAHPAGLAGKSAYCGQQRRKPSRPLRGEGAIQIYQAKWGHRKSRSGKSRKPSPQVQEPSGANRRIFLLIALQRCISFADALFPYSAIALGAWVVVAVGVLALQRRWG